MRRISLVALGLLLAMTLLTRGTTGPAQSARMVASNLGTITAARCSLTISISSAYQRVSSLFIRIIAGLPSASPSAA